MKKAIVIGNQNYRHISKLRNAINDAKDIKQILEAKYFDVSYYENLPFLKFLNIIQNFLVDLAN